MRYLFYNILACLLGSSLNCAVEIAFFSRILRKMDVGQYGLMRRGANNNPVLRPFLFAVMRRFETNMRFVSRILGTRVRLLEA
ncbi:hypothetical protein C8R47DRAFT_1122028 [Mycena vitilis]|nr:hypothetical protein C8R47DRAFT_1122028 [Mycena vitilis]